MSYIDDWHDWVRVVVICISLYGCVTLIKRHRTYSHEWNVKTLDYWYALFMWCVVGVVLSLQGIILDRPFTPAVVVVTAATLVTGKGLHRKGSWGGST